MAKTVANIPVGALVVFYGDFTYTPDGEWIGQMVVERVEQVNLPYSDETELTAEFAHPDNLFSFAYPEGWTLIVGDNGNIISLLNRSQSSELFVGPGIEYYDPTAISLAIRLEMMSLEDYIETRQVFDPTIIVNEREINGWLVTQIEEESYPYGTYLRYVIPINDDMILVLSFDHADAPFAERLLSTLSINQQ